MTDTERLDFLQSLVDEQRYTGKVRLRDSTTGRGMRLHETNSRDGVPSVREAIDNFMEQREPLRGTARTMTAEKRPWARDPNTPDVGEKKP